MGDDTNTGTSGSGGADTGAGTTGAHTPPEGATATAVWEGPDGPVPYTCDAGWTVLADAEGEALAEVFAVSYVAGQHGDADVDRPVTFVFNGGPGASAAFLHVGALGPRRVGFGERGRLLPAPARLVDNAESWLAFTDLVFVDPVGTGWSKVVKAPADAEKPEGADPRAFYGFKRDLESLGEVVSRWLSANDRWASPVVVAGESYGGYRAAKMVRQLAEQEGVGLVGAVLISPAMELHDLEYGDYDVASYVDVLPTMAATAFLHGRSTAFGDDAAVEDVFTAAEGFATGDYATLLVRGSAMEPQARAATFERLAAMTGLPAEAWARAEGRIHPRRFARELLRDVGEVVAMYDGSTTAADPFPDRPEYEAPDPTLHGLMTTFAAGVNARLRSELGVRTDRLYQVLSYDVHGSWASDIPAHAFERKVGATDDLRYGMQLQPHVQVFLTHGRYDLVTPYFASDRLRALMRLPGGAADRITTRHYAGGHMFYAWDRSRVAFRDDVAAFYRRAVSPPGP